MIEAFQPKHEVKLTPQELVADLIFDMPLELALQTDHAARKVHAALQPGILPQGPIWVRSNLYWAKAGEAQPWHTDFNRGQRETPAQYLSKVKNRTIILFAYGEEDLNTDYLERPSLEEVLLLDVPFRIADVNRHISQRTDLRIRSFGPQQFLRFKPDIFHRRLTASTDHFRRIILFHDQEPLFESVKMNPLQKLTSNASRERYKEIRRGA